ncbi:MAG: hypothetical protein ONB12_06880 [candidate division KSB1 bacterium]|nr:hypothetical protein [candidate division KSB1 bacterium]
MGSGLYSAGPYVAQIYRGTPSVTLLSPFQHRWGITLRVPVTAGFLNYTYWDIFRKGLPNSLETVGILPMVEIEHYSSPTFSLAPVLGAGAAVNLRNRTHVWGVVMGIRHLFFIPLKERQLRLYSLMLYGTLWTPMGKAYDELAMWKSGGEIRQKLGRKAWGKELDAGFFVLSYFYYTSPHLWIHNEEAGRRRFEVEVGATFGTFEPTYIWKFKLPRLMVGYRFSSDRPAVILSAGDSFPIPSPREQERLKGSMR